MVLSTRCRYGAGHRARLPESGRAYAFARIAPCPRSTCASTPRPAAHTRKPDTPIDAGILPAASVAFRMLVGFVLGGPPGRGMARQPAASCGLISRAMDDRSAGVLAGGAPSSDNLPDQFAIDRRATAWMARRCAVLGREARHIRARVEPCPMGREPGKDARLPIAPSRTRARRQDAADAAQSPAARRAAKNKPSHPPDLPRSSRQDAGVDWRVRQHCASRRTRRRCTDLSADTGHIRAKAEAFPTSREPGRMPGSESYFARNRGRSECRPGGPPIAHRVQAQWPIESAAERTRASVGPEGRTER